MAGMAKWIACELNIWEVHGLRPGLAWVDSKDPLHTSDIKHSQWCIHPGFKTHGQNQPKCKTEYQWLHKMVTLSPQKKILKKRKKKKNLITWTFLFQHL